MMNTDTPTLLPTVALSIKQPWASLIVHGVKDVENRTWSTKFRGPVLIHASKVLRKLEFEGCGELMVERRIELPEGCALEGLAFKEYPAGGIVGVAEIVGCVSASDSPWFVGDYGFVIANAWPLPFWACRGALGFWKCESYPVELWEGV